MNDEEIKRMIDNTYDDVKEDTLRASVKYFYGRKMQWTAIGFSIYCTVFYVLGILSAVLFFYADETKYQIMFAALFLFLMQRSALIKTIGWQGMNKHSIKREITRLEIRIAELNQTLKKGNEQ
jgi:hypothetical protein